MKEIKLLMEHIEDELEDAHIGSSFENSCNNLSLSVELM